MNRFQKAKISGPACLILFIITLMVCNAAHASKQEELENLRKRITALKQDLDKTSESKSEAADALRDSEISISNSNRKLQELSLQQKAASNELEHLHAKSAQLENEMQNEQGLLGKLLYQQYIGGKQEYLKLLLNNRDPNQVARELQYYDYIARSRADWLKSLRSKLQEIQNVAQQTQQKSDEIASLQKQAEQQKQRLETEKHARQHTLNQIAKQLNQQRLEIGRLQRDENHLSRLVERITKMLERRARESQLRNENLPDNSFDGKPFTTLKGKLSLPVKGVVSNKFGEHRPHSPVLWKGLFLRAPANKEIKAVAAGRVVFADWLRGFGNLLIIDHGHGYMSLYGNTETLYKQVGDAIHGGDTIATVGNSGGNDEYGLYFELRHQGVPFDPINWLSR